MKVSPSLWSKLWRLGQLWWLLVHCGSWSLFSPVCCYLVYACSDSTMNDDLWNRSASVSASPRFDFLRMRILIDGLNKFSNKDCMSCHLNQGTKNLVVLLIRYNNRPKVIFHQHFCTSIVQTQLSKFPTNIFSVMKKACKKVLFGFYLHE